MRCMTVMVMVIDVAGESLSPSEPTCVTWLACSRAPFLVSSSSRCSLRHLALHWRTASWARSFSSSLLRVLSWRSACASRCSTLPRLCRRRPGVGVEEEEKKREEKKVIPLKRMKQWFCLCSHVVKICFSRISSDSLG